MSGNSIINYYAGANVTISGFDSSTGYGYSGDSYTYSGSGPYDFSGINQINAELGGTLTGDTNASTWTLASTGYTYLDGTGSNTESLTFSGFHTLQGGSGSNEFDVNQTTSAHLINLIGGTGTNDFVFSDGATLDGSIVGGTGSGTDTLDLSAYTTNLSAALTGSNATTGLAGTVSLTTSGAKVVTGGFTGINDLKAGTGTNTLTGEGDASTWSLNGSTTTYNDGTATLTFSRFENLYGGAGFKNTFDVLGNTTANLHGGAGANDFVFSPGAVLTGSIAGGADIDTLDLSDYTTNLSAALTGSSATGLTGTVGPVTSGFTGIDCLYAGSGSSIDNTLTGDTNPSTWNLNSTQTYYDGTATLTFSGFRTLDGGSAANTFNILANFSSSGLNLNLNLNGGTGSNDFVFHNGGSLNGAINGQTATNSTIDYSAYTSAVTVNLGTGTSTGTNGISNIGTLVGGSNTTLVGPNTAITWTINGANSGTLPLNSGTFHFSSVKNLSGGVLANTFYLSTTESTTGSVSGAITGGSTSDTLDLSGLPTAATVNVTNNNAGSVRIGGSTVLNFSRIANVKGTTGTDDFVLSNGKGLTGTLTGGGGTGDTLDYSAYTTSVRVNLTTGVATGIDGGLASGIISGIANVVGGSGNDILIGGSSTTSLTDGKGNDIIVGGGGPVTINGGRGNDIIITGDTTSADTVTVYGNGGTDLMIGGSYTQQTNLAALNSLMAEWDRTDVSLSTKIAHLTGTQSGGRNGSFVLTGGTGGTVTTDTNSSLSLYGGNPTTTPTTSSSGNNWFIAYSNNTTTGPVKDKTGNDQITVF